ncbi:GTP-binding protein [Micrococcoides hystricis]|uniref:GTP-binding protein n=1 Tax=Micrococcoides hystricis TaxID=1572761 RepID=A0ABV6PAN4_9MICC
MKLILLSASDQLASHQGLRAAAELTRADVVVRAIGNDHFEILDTRTGVMQRTESSVWNVLVELNAREPQSSNGVIALPTLTSSSSLAARVDAELSNSTVMTCGIAVDPNWIEDQLWDTTDEQHQFLNTELDFVDTVFLASSEIWSPSGTARERGIDLISTLSPHARRITCPSQQRRICGNASRLGSHNLGDALHRVSAALGENVHTGRFQTVVLHHELPLPSEQFYRYLPELAAGSVRIRGQLWLDSHLTDRLHVQGCGPQVWVENRGPWHPVEELAYTEVSFTGENLDTGLLERFLPSTHAPISHITEEGTL